MSVTNINTVHAQPEFTVDQKPLMILSNISTAVASASNDNRAPQTLLPALYPSINSDGNPSISDITRKPDIKPNMSSAVAISSRTFIPTEKVVTEVICSVPGLAIEQANIEIGGDLGGSGDAPPSYEESMQNVYTKTKLLCKSELV